MKLEEIFRAMAAMSMRASAPAATWVGSKLEDDRLVVRCTRCGLEAVFLLPPNIRGPADVPAGLDEELFAWRHAFQAAHERCAEVIA